MPTDDTECMLSIVASTDLGDDLADWLLTQEDNFVFMSETIDCHGIDPDSLNLAEQVAGRQGKLLFRIQTNLGRAHRLCRDLAVRFPGARPRYWIQPVLEAGVIETPQPGDESC